MGLFTKAVKKMLPAIQIEGCCGEDRLPIYTREAWEINNAPAYFLHAPLPDEKGITHVQGPGNIHVYFTVVEGGTVEVESPLDFLNGVFSSIEEARQFTAGKLKANRFPAPKNLIQSLTTRGSR